MPEANQYVFSNKELLELLIKQAGVREGRWTLMTNFGVTPGNIGQTPDQIAPGIAIVIGQMGIQRAPVDSPEQLSLDAAVINPNPSKRGKS